MPLESMTGGCELPYVGAEDATWILYKSSQCSQLLTHLFSPVSNVYSLYACCKGSDFYTHLGLQ